MTDKLRVAALQYCAAGDVRTTRARIEPLLDKAVAGKARLICLPEAATFLAESRAALDLQAEWEDDGASLKWLSSYAASHSIWLMAGSLFIRRRADSKLVNRCYLITPDGMVAAHYDKIHMFDADVGDGQSYRESASFAAGDTSATATVDDIIIGLTICYDIRFPHLYRRLATDGAAVLSTPAAFTYDSGRAHWHVLQRARAIETGCYVIAPAQCGTHADGRRTYGHAMIISPWGEILAEAPTDDSNATAGANDAVIFAEIDPDQVDRARRAIPSLRNERHFS